MTKLFIYSNVILLSFSSFLSPVTTVEGISSNFINTREKIIKKAKEDNFKNQFTINSTIEEDLQSFNFDYQKFLFNENQISNPIIVNFKPSFSKDYVSLFYVYYPLNTDDSFYLNGSITNENNEVIYLEDIELGVIDSNEEGFLRLTYKTELTDELSSFIDNSLKLKFIINIKSSNLKSDDCYFNFDKQLTNDDRSLIRKEYSKTTNLNETKYYHQDFSTYTTIIELNDPHVWSYRFDTDNSWENFLESAANLFGFDSDSLEDQFFYSFSLPYGWSDYEIADISLRWKEVLLTAYSYNIVSNIDIYDYFETETSEGTINSDCDEYNNHLSPLASYSSAYDNRFLGYTKNQVKNNTEYHQDPYVYDTISPTVVSSNIGSTTYTWKKIQTVSEFNNAFRELDDILTFASSYMPADNYYIINFDEFEYNYNNVFFAFESAETVINPTGYYQEFIDYLNNSGLDVSTRTESIESSLGSFFVTYRGYEIYKFTMNYHMDVEATNMTLVNSNGGVIEATVSVSPVDQENSGGTANNDFFTDLFNDIGAFFSNAWNIITVIFYLVVALLVLALIGKIISLFRKKD